MVDLTQLHDAILRGDAKKAVAVTKEALAENASPIVALSALLTTTMPFMKSTIEELKKAGVREQVKVMVGGAPVTQQYAEQIGADGYSDNANGAVAIARKLTVG